MNSRVTVENYLPPAEKHLREQSNGLALSYQKANVLTFYAIPSPAIS